MAGPGLRSDHVEILALGDASHLAGSFHLFCGRAPASWPRLADQNRTIAMPKGSQGQKPKKLPVDPVSRAVAVMREATGQPDKDQATAKLCKKTKKAAR